MNRRQFFASLAAGILLHKPTAPPPVPPPATEYITDLILGPEKLFQFHREAFALVTPPLTPTMSRLDIFYGVSMIPEMACRIVNRDRRPFFGPPKPLRLFDPARLPL